MQTIEAHGRSTPPDWAIRQRHLFDLMNQAAPAFVERYTRPDGTFERLAFTLQGRDAPPS